MSETRKTAKLRIEELVHFFEHNIHQFKAPSFNETQARQQLIDPFFEALGWDITNRAMKPLYLQEVIPEGRVKTSFGKEVREQTAMFDAKESLGKKYKEYASILDYIAEDEYRASAKEATKKPDYRFRIKGQTKFFVEAKKPFVDLSRNQDAIFQVKRYGFSGRVPVSILTDFEEFRVFDCTHKPLYEKPTLGVIKELDLTYAQYFDEFDHLYDTFSREAVDTGSLDTLTQKLLRKKTGDFALDKSFLDDLSKWREELARDIAKHPRNRRTLNDYRLNESVQRILDRIVFFRVCEDREIEVENTLLAVLQMWKSRPGVSLYSLLNQLFQQRRTLYNGLLFSPHECEELEVGDDVLIKILQNLNYPFSPYHFNEIGVEILGSIYEKFLGKTIHLAKKNVIISEKPEVRKAGGVYYTPQYIVNYIVDNTLGKLLYEDASTLTPSVSSLSMTDKKEKVILRVAASRHESAPEAHEPLAQKESEERKLKLSPKQVAKLKIIDIACGSGSFLLGAFQKLIDYHIEWYHQHPKDIQTVNNVPDAYTDVNGNLRLSSRKKRDILVNNIYGVDIDRQAVEVTQMSLYLKVLENENADTLNPQMTLALKEVYLPSLADNIKCGNSLIGTDFGAQGEMFDDSARMKINAFDWEMEFAEIMRPSSGSGGGFDCVIGNPPYIFTRDEGLTSEEKKYYYSKFKYQSSQLNTFGLFLEYSFKLINNNGLLGFITPNNWLTIDSFTKLREFCVKQTRQLRIFNVIEKVFESANVDTAIVFLGKQGKTEITLGEIENGQEVFSREVDPDELSRRNYIFRIVNLTDTDDYLVIEKIECYKELSQFSTVSTGLKAYQTGKGKPKQKDAAKTNRIFHSRAKKNKTYKKYLDGKDVSRYFLGWSKEYLSYGDWLAEPRKSVPFNGDRILVRQIPSKPPYCLHAVWTNKEVLNDINSMVIFGLIEPYNYFFILALLNSKLLSYWFQRRFDKFQRKIFPQFKVKELARFPIRTINFSDPNEKKQHGTLVGLTDRMLELHKQLNATNFDSEKEPVERQIKVTDNKIDQLVYQLYGLTEEEIRVVEGEKGKSP